VNAPRLLALGVLPVALTGCGAGFDAVTYQERNNAGASDNTVGDIAVRNAVVEAPPGGAPVYEAGEDAVVTFTLVSIGPEGDTLVAASSPDATSVDIVVGDIQRPVTDVDVRAFDMPEEDVAVILRGLGSELRSGAYVELRLRFERAGTVELVVPVDLTGEYDDDREHSENFHVVGEEEHGGEAGEAGEGGLREAGEEQTE
jgi:copper(I)-binding protein